MAPSELCALGPRRCARSPPCSDYAHKLEQELGHKPRFLVQVRRAAPAARDTPDKLHACLLAVAPAACGEPEFRHAVAAVLLWLLE